MKLQKFIETYQRRQLETPTSRSPDRSYVFKTSQSIGTLNSQDENATDRSFAVKQQHTSLLQNCESIQHLKELCESQRDLERKQVNHLAKDVQKQYQQWLQTYESPTFSKTQTSNHSFVKNRSKGILQQQDGEISFSVYPDNCEFLYEQAPSQLYEGCPTEENTMRKQEEIWFLQTYSHLLQKLTLLEQQNTQFQNQLENANKLSDYLTEKEQTLELSVSQLKQSVSIAIQSNIELQNKIKEMLLKHQMEKYSFVSKDKDMVSALRSCNSEKNVNLKFNRKEKK